MDAETVQRLGYPAGSRLVIINSDDFGMCHAANVGTMQILAEGFGTAASLMVPCPWAPEALQMALKRPDLSIGVELVLTSEWEGYRWAPVASKDRVRSLMDKDGFFWGNNELVGRHVKVEEAEIELRAQVDRVLEAGMKPSHFVNHMGSLTRSNRDDLKALYAKLSREYRLPARGLFSSRQIGYELYYMTIEGKAVKLYTILDSLQAGLYELYPHCAVDGPEIRSITGYSHFVDNDRDSWRGRVSDTELYTDPRVKKEIDHRKITLVTWREINERAQKAGWVA
jgi:chitin disaccharide deacetylase